jgi:hypothetical protein
MRRLTLWIVSTFAAMSMLVSYQLSLGDTPDTGHHGDCVSTAAITTATPHHHRHDRLTNAHD